MPELPEVETVKRGLQKLVIGKTISSVAFDWPKGFPNTQADVDEFLVGATITGISRRAKVLLIDVDTNYTLVIHLKMTGQLVYVPSGEFKDKSLKIKEEERFGAGHPNESLIGNLPDKSTRVIFHFQETFKKSEVEKRDSALESNARKQRGAEGTVQKVQRLSTEVADKVVGQEQSQHWGLCPQTGDCGAHLFFNDQRKFGWVRLLPTIEVPNIDFMKKLGPEPLASSFTATHFVTRVRRRNKSCIKAVLLDQTVVAGVGNIYADESLWAAKIHPETKVLQISDKKLKVLYRELVSVLELSIEKGGSSDRNYVNAEGKKGSYISFDKVFRREGQPCLRCGASIHKIRVAGRGTHVCVICQEV